LCKNYYFCIYYNTQAKERNPIMQTATNQSRKHLSTATQRVEETRPLTKLGQWRRDNPGGIIRVLDRRAVNK
jgi:hypothetical protein